MSLNRWVMYNVNNVNYNGGDVICEELFLLSYSMGRTTIRC